MSSKIYDTIKDGVLNNSLYTLNPIDCKIKLNQNESPFDVPNFVKKKILNNLKKKSWNIYPDFIPDDLYKKLANYLKVEKENILIGNGSNEMIFTILVATLEKGKKLIISEPTFTVYKLIGTNLNAEVVSILQNDDFSNNIEKISDAASNNGSVTIIANPNSPTGSFSNKKDLIKIVESSNGIVVIDEAYIQFGGESLLDLVDRYDNLIILRTFSKAFGLAALRIGAMVANQTLIKELSKVKLPYNINIFTQETLSILLDKKDIIDHTVKEIIKYREFLFRELEKINSIKVFPSAANFFLIRVDDSKLLFNKLVKYGILVRDFSSYPMLKNCLRISVGNMRENRYLIKVLTEIYKK